MVALIEKKNVVFLIIFLAVIILILGASYIYKIINIKPLDMQKSCGQWAEKNNIEIPTCIGSWIIESGNCSWKCKNGDEFCGSSTNFACSTDADCKLGGCSSQVCQGKNEEDVITTCEYKDCFNSEKFGLSCGCFNNKCGWK